MNRPDGKTIAYGYDSAGRPSTLTIARGTFAYSYDAAKGSLTSISAPGGIGTAYTYDGNLPTGTTWTGSVTGSVSRSYDNDLRVVGVAVNGASIATVYDNDSLVTQAGALTLTRSAQNGYAQRVRRSRTRPMHGHTTGSERWPRTAPATSATPILAQQFTRDKLGRITQKTETIGGVTDAYVLHLRSGRATHRRVEERGHHRHLHVRRQRQPAEPRRPPAAQRSAPTTPGPPDPVRHHALHLHRQRRAAEQDRRRPDDDLRVRRDSAT